MSTFQTITQGPECPLGHRDYQQIQPKRPPLQIARIMDAARTIHRPCNRQHMDRTTIRQTDLGKSRTDGARQIMIGNRICTQRDTGRDTMAGHLANRRRDHHTRYRQPRRALCTLDCARDRIGSVFHIDDHTTAHALGLDMASPRDTDGIVGTAHTVRLHDKAGNLGLAQIKRSHGRRLRRTDLIRFLVPQKSDHLLFLPRNSQASPSEGRIATSSGVRRSTRAKPKSRRRSRWSSASRRIRAES